jgi:DNA (cytosine-5)-methyltransferase 1
LAQAHPEAKHGTLVPLAHYVMRVAGLFSGIGGLELGLSRAGHESVMLCEIDPYAREVLKQHFDLPIEPDVRNLSSLPKCDLLAAGFPCQDLSQAGTKCGISGQRSGLVGEIFRLCSGPSSPPFVLLENVQNMISLGGGQAMEVLTKAFEDLGYQWAYRVVDARSFSIPQRRQRVIFIASKDFPPEQILMADFADDPSAAHDNASAKIATEVLYGFYWTEGLRGLGWTRDAVPTIKGGSTIGIPSPPAIWDPGSGFVGTPSITDSERLQGFDASWTSQACMLEKGERRRWHLVGNAVCVPMAEWVGKRLNNHCDASDMPSKYSLTTKRWPKAASGKNNDRFFYDVSPRVYPHCNLDLHKFLSEALKPLSVRACTGFLRRAYHPKNRLIIPQSLLKDLQDTVNVGIQSLAA